VLNGCQGFFKKYILQILYGGHRPACPAGIGGMETEEKQAF